ncbi:MAG: class I SAM-dependent methyltransferase [Thermoplasmata archaeon]
MDFDSALARCLTSGISAEDRVYVDFHAARFREIIAIVLRQSQPGAAVANVGLSCFDLIATEVMSDRRYVSLVPSEAFAARFPAALYARIPRLAYDVTRDEAPPDQRFDVVILADVLEHLFCEDEPVIDRLKRTMAPDGAAVLSFPNAMRHVNRLKAVLGRNIFPGKTDIVHGVFGGFGHIREYSIGEVRKLLEPRFRQVAVTGLNAYGTPAQRRAMRLLPSSMRSTILAVARGPRG